MESKWLGETESQDNQDYHQVNKLQYGVMNLHNNNNGWAPFPKMNDFRNAHYLLYSFSFIKTVKEAFVTARA